LMRIRFSVLYKIKATQTAHDLLASFHPEIKKTLKDALKDLKKNPNLGKDLQRDLGGYQSYRIKRYRIIYKIDIVDKAVVIHYVGHRRDVYELFAGYLMT